MFDASASSEMPTGSARPAKIWHGYVAFTICTAAYLLPFMRFINPTSDEGMLLNGAVKISQGQVFARDFFEVIGPGTFYWLAAFFKLFGTNFFAARTCVFISSLGTALAIYFLSRQVCRRYRLLSSLLFAAVSFGAAWPGASHHLDSNFSSLLCISCLVFWATGHKTGWLIAAGILAALTTCVHHPKGVLLLGSILFWLWLQRRYFSAPLLAAGVLLASYALVITIVLAYFWSRGALASLVYANYIFPSQHYSSANTVPYGQGIKRDYWGFWMMITGRFPWSTPVGLLLLFPLIFVAGIVPLMLIIGLINGRKALTSTVILYGLAGCALWISELHRLDIYHLVFASPLFLILFVAALGEKSAPIRSGIAIFLYCEAALLMTFNWFVVDWMAHPMATRAGMVYMLGKDPALDFLNQNLPSGAEMWVYPYAPTYYFLTGAKNPTRFSVFVYSLHTRSQAEEVIDTLERRHVEYVVWDSTFIPRVSTEVYRGAQPTAREGIIEPYIESHYRIVRDYNGVRILERAR